MSDSADAAALAHRFNEAVRAFTPPSPSRHAKLMPFKEGIVELRQKGGSLRLIRELLATVNVAVGTDTIARFLADVNGEQAPQRTAKGPARGRAFNPPPTQPRPVPDHSAVLNTQPIPTPPQPLPQPPVPAPATAVPTERPRIRGPRIADPSNL
jgi:hypothetical protein